MKDILSFIWLGVAAFGMGGALWVLGVGGYWYHFVGVLALAAMAYPKAREIWNRIILKKE